MIRNKRDRAVKTLVLCANLPKECRWEKIWFYPSYVRPWQVWGMGFSSFDEMIGHIKRYSC